MKSTKVFLLEDDVNQAFAYRRALIEQAYEVLPIAPAQKQAYQIIEQTQPDIAILDIRLGDDDPHGGIAVGKWLYEQYPNMPIIYLTAQTQEYEASLNTYPFAFIEKVHLTTNPPILWRAIGTALNKIKGKKEQESEQMLIDKDCIWLKKLRGEDRIYKVNIPNDIYYLEAYGHYTKVWCTGKTIYLYKGTIGRMLKNLEQWEGCIDNSNKTIMQIHRSYAINVAKIDSIANKCNNCFVGKQELPVGKTFKEAVKKRFPFFGS